MTYNLQHVERLPKVPEPEVLYWSEDFGMCSHVCACGCGDIIKLPVDEQNFAITGSVGAPTLRPSVGNWGVCDAHYFITNGEIVWLAKMSADRIREGRAFEDARRAAYYAVAKPTWKSRLAAFVRKLFSR